MSECFACLYPTEKYKNRRDLIERLLEQRQAIEILKLGVVGEQAVELLAHQDGSVDAQRDRRVAQTNREQVHDVVDIRKVFHSIET